MNWEASILNKKIHLHRNHTDSDDCPNCKAVLEDLENIDTDTDKHGIAFVKTKDAELAEEYGCKSFPALIYFEKQTPSVYHGDISAEEDVLQWLIQQRTEDTIESVNRELLENLIENSHYLVVFFCKLFRSFDFFG